MCQNHMSWNMCLTRQTRSAIRPEYLLNIINMLHMLITLTPSWKDGFISEITGKINGKARSTPEGTWTMEAKLKYIPCIYNIVGDKKHKLTLRIY